MNIIVRKSRNFIAGAGIAAAIAVPVGQAVMQPEPTCVAHMIVFEDGTWSGAEIDAADGSKIADRWDVAGPELQGQIIDGVFYTNFPPSVNGQECTVTIG